MLAQNFKTAEELGLIEAELDALRKTLVLLETGQLTHVSRPNADFDRGHPGLKYTGHFNMRTWESPHSCGTVACIGGTAQLIGNLKFDFERMEGRGLEKLWNLRNLFYPEVVVDWDTITVEEAATALRNYLTRGKADWSSIICGIQPLP